METLVVYDDNGTIFFQASGSATDPVGLPFLRFTVPNGQKVQRIDTTSEPHTPVFEAMPRPASEVQAEEIEQLKNLVIDLTEIVLMGGV
jgi:hypothetical protein